MASTFLSGFAIATDGTLWAWGSNSNGELARSPFSTSYSLVPVQIGASAAWDELAAGTLHVLGRQGTALYGWGSNGNSQLAQGSSVGFVATPTRILSTQSISRLGAGDYHSFAITASGALYAWGMNVNGQLGGPNSGVAIGYASPTLVQTALAPWAEVDGAANFTLAKTANGRYYTFGANNLGQLGVGSVDAGGGLSFNYQAAEPDLSGVNLAANAPVISGGGSELGVKSSIGPVSVTVTNSGGVALSESFTVSLYLSRDSILDLNDLQLVSRTESGPLAAQAVRTVQFDSVAVPAVSTGSWFLLSQVNPVSVVDSYAPDNGAALAVTVRGPDLTVDSLQTPATQIAAGGNLAASFRLANVGTGAVGTGETVTIEAFLSPSANFVSGTAILLASRTHTGGLASAGSVTIPASGSWSLSVPSAQAAGSYYLLVMANRNGAVAEDGATTNVLAQAITVTSYDLAVTQPTLRASISPSSLGVNTVLESVSTTFQNVGNSGYAGGGSIALYLSTDSIWDSGDRILYVGGAQAIVAAPALTGVNGGGSSRVITWNNVALPDVTPSQLDALGDYYLVARFIPAAGDTDASPANNQASLAVALNPPDFSFDNFTFPHGTSVESDGSFGNVTYRLRNIGQGAVAKNREVQISVYISEDDRLNPIQDALLDRYFYSGTEPLLPAGSIALPQEDRALALPQGLPSGSYYLLFVVNENGNVPGVGSFVASRLVSIGSLDVQVTSPSLEAAGPLGVNTFLSDITLSVINDGGFSVLSGLIVKLRLSTDDQIDAGDYLLDVKTIDMPLAANSPHSITFSDIKVPDLGSGAFWLLAEVLLPDGLHDSNFTNNISSLAVTLERPDLLITSVDLGDDALDLDAGQTSLTSVRFNVRNDSAALVPAGVSYLVYLSSDKVLDDKVDPLLVSGSLSGPLGPNDVVEVGPFTLTPGDGTLGGKPAPPPLGGTYQIFFVINFNEDRDAIQVAESDTTNNTYWVRLLIQKETAPGLGLDLPSLKIGAGVPWVTVPDSRSSDGVVYQSPALTTVGETSILRYSVEGPTTISVPWLLIADSTATVPDSLSYRLDGGAWQALSSSYTPTYRPHPISIPAPTAAGMPTVVEWRFIRGNSAASGYARVDLDSPAISSSSDGAGVWQTAPDVAGIGGDVTTTTPILSGQQVSLETVFAGPGILTFWWRIEAEETDELRLFLNDDPYFFPTYDYDATAIPARVTGVSPWRKVAVLLRPGQQVVRWTYSQGSDNTSARAYLDGFQFQTPLPSGLSPNRLTDPAVDDAYEAVPEGTVDLMVVKEGTTTPAGATYLLDDAAGSGRLPIQVTLRNQGYNFATNPAWDATKLYVSLSPDSTFGDGNDVLLGDYAKLTSVVGEGMVTFSAEINLPFDLASGNYRVRVRYAGSSGLPEFTLANNTADLGSIAVLRAPNLEIDWQDGPAADFPWRPEDSVSFEYLIKNSGLGPILADSKFHVSVKLLRLDLPDDPVVKDYGETPFNVFIPERSAEFPDGVAIPVNSFVDLPSARDILVASHKIPPGTPEDSPLVFDSRGSVTGLYAFQFLVDSRDAVLESSESNVFTGTTFSIVQLQDDSGGFVSTVGDFIGDRLFGTRLSKANFLNNAAFVGSADYRRFIQAYALGLVFNGSSYGPEGSPQLGYDTLAHNGHPAIVIPPNLSQSYLTLTFAFNALADDVELDVQAADSPAGPWSDILTLTPPFDEPTGPSSLTGYGGVKDSPFVLAVDGNFTGVQRVWRPLVTVRDLVPLSNASARFMRLQVRPTVSEVPVAPITLFGGFSSFTGSVYLVWTLPAETSQPPKTRYLIERSPSLDSDYSIIGHVDGTVTSFIDVGPFDNIIQYYRIRAINVAGTSAYIISNPVSLQ